MPSVGRRPISAAQTGGSGTRRDASAAEVVYGELVVVGYNGSMPTSTDATRMRNKFVLYQRPQANGVKPERKHVLRSPASSKVLDSTCHSVSYTLSRSESVVVEYGPDDSTDMFQVGRSSEPQIDFIVADTPLRELVHLAPSGDSDKAKPESNDSVASSALSLAHRRPIPQPRTPTVSPSTPSRDIVGASAVSRGRQAALPAVLETLSLVDETQPSSNKAQAATSARSLSRSPTTPTRPPLVPKGAATGGTAAVAAGHSAAGDSQMSYATTVAAGCQGHSAPPSSTISRFACRVVVSRSPPHTARLYAAGFDSCNRIVLGEKATKWCYDDEFDGLTTNGIHLRHPPETGNCFERSRLDSGSACGSGRKASTQWREVSVCGRTFPLQGSALSPTLNTKALPDAGGNVLHDGTLIDLCGATLMWRSAAGRKLTMEAADLEDYIEMINQGRPQCPVGLNTLVLPQRLGMAAGSSSASPYVYLSCGHVHGAHAWQGRVAKQAAPDDAACAPSCDQLRTCPLCLQEQTVEDFKRVTCLFLIDVPHVSRVGPFVMLQLGCEPSLYVDKGPPTHCFVPCAHMASEMTIKYWSSTALPYRGSSTDGHVPLCPFCYAQLPSDGVKYTRLVFQDNSGF